MASATLVVTSWWFIEPLAPASSLALNVQGSPTAQHENIAVHYALSPPGVVTTPVVISGGVQGTDGQLSVQTQSLAEWQALKASLASGTTKWLISPFSEGTYARCSAASAIGGQSGAAHQTTVVGPSTTPYRVSQITYVQVGAPAGT
jgi:hypothetical protein